MPDSLFSTQFQQVYSNPGALFPSPQDWRDCPIYFLMVDRFNNPTNAPAHLPFDNPALFAYQGGTFDGVRAARYDQESWCAGDLAEPGAEEPRRRRRLLSRLRDSRLPDRQSAVRNRCREGCPRNHVPGYRVAIFKYNRKNRVNARAPFRCFISPEKQQFSLSSLLFSAIISAPDSGLSFRQPYRWLASAAIDGCLATSKQGHHGVQWLAPPRLTASVGR